MPAPRPQGPVWPVPMQHNPVKAACRLVCSGAVHPQLPQVSEKDQHLKNAGRQAHEPTQGMRPTRTAGKTSTKLKEMR